MWRIVYERGNLYNDYSYNKVAVNVYIIHVCVIIIVFW